MAERHKCEHYGQLRRVVHFAEGAQVMLLLNVRTSWDLVNGLRGTVVAVVFADPSTASGSVNAAELGGVSASSVDYVVVDFPGYSGPETVPGHPTWVLLRKETLHNDQYPQPCAVSHHSGVRHHGAQEPGLDPTGRRSV